MLLRLTIHSHISPPPSPPTHLTPSVPATPRVENIGTSSWLPAHFQDLRLLSRRQSPHPVHVHPHPQHTASKYQQESNLDRYRQAYTNMSTGLCAHGVIETHCYVYISSSTMEYLCWADQYHRIIHNLFVGHFSIAGQSSSAVSVLSFPCSWQMPIYLRC